MEETNKEKYEGKGHKSPMPSPSVPSSQDFHVFAKTELSEPVNSAFLWRFHYSGMID